MKLSPEERLKFERLMPSKFSASGFLGSDNRSVDEIIAEDSAYLDKQNVTCAEIADFLKVILDKSKSALGSGIEISSGVTATHFESRGKIPSPFRGDGVFEKGETVVEETTTGTSFSITDLSIQLIRKHSFFQGKGSPYRVEPSTVVSLFKKSKAS
jgi:hypothetical protein